MAVIICPYCKKYISSKLDVCPECGGKLSPVQSEAEAPQAEPIQSQESAGIDSTPVDVPITQTDDAVAEADSQSHEYEVVFTEETTPDEPTLIAASSIKEVPESVQTVEQPSSFADSQAEPKQTEPVADETLKAAVVAEDYEVLRGTNSPSASPWHSSSSSLPSSASSISSLPTTDVLWATSRGRLSVLMAAPICFGTRTT